MRPRLRTSAEQLPLYTCIFSWLSVAFLHCPIAATTPHHPDGDTLAYYEYKCSRVWVVMHHSLSSTAHKRTEQQHLGYRGHQGSQSFTKLIDQYVIRQFRRARVRGCQSAVCSFFQ